MFQPIDLTHPVIVKIIEPRQPAIRVVSREEADRIRKAQAERTCPLCDAGVPKGGHR